MKNTNHLKSGDRVRISGTLIYGTVHSVFDSKIVYVQWDEPNFGMQKMDCTKLSYKLSVEIKNRIEKLKDYSMKFFSEKNERRFLTFTIWFFIILMLYNIFASIFN